MHEPNLAYRTTTYNNNQQGAYRSVTTLNLSKCGSCSRSGIYGIYGVT